MTQTIIQAPALVRDRGKLADNTRRLQVDFQELKENDELEIIKHSNKMCWIALAGNEMQVEDIKIPDQILEKGQKSQSQRLRAVIYKVWEYKHQADYSDFEVFYRTQIEHLINQYKKKLE